MSNDTGPAQGGRNFERQDLQAFADHLHALGPLTLAYFLTELANGAELQTTIEAYSRLEPETVRNRAPIQDGGHQQRSHGCGMRPCPFGGGHERPQHCGCARR
jgi:hypothetical protein